MVWYSSHGYYPVIPSQGLLPIHYFPMIISVYFPTITSQELLPSPEFPMVLQEMKPFEMEIEGAGDTYVPDDGTAEPLASIFGGEPF